MAFGSFSLYLLCETHISILRPVYDIFRRVSGQNTAQIVHADMPYRVLYVRVAQLGPAICIGVAARLHVPQPGSPPEAVRSQTHHRRRPCQAVLQGDTRSSVPARLPLPTSHRRSLSSRADAPQSRPAVSRVRQTAMTMSARGAERLTPSVYALPRSLQYGGNRCVSSRRAQLRQNFHPAGHIRADVAHTEYKARSCRKSSPHGRIFARYLRLFIAPVPSNRRYSAARLPIAYSAMIVPNARMHSPAPLCGRFPCVYLSAPPKSAAADAGFRSAPAGGFARFAENNRSRAKLLCGRVFAVLREREPHCRYRDQVFNVSRLVQITVRADTKTDVFSFCIVFSPLSVRILQLYSTDFRFSTMG